MKNYEFICWLEGYRDLCSDDRVTPKKLRILRNHLNLVRAVEGALGEINESIMQEISRLLDNDVSQHLVILCVGLFIVCKIIVSGNSVKDIEEGAIGHCDGWHSNGVPSLYQVQAPSAPVKIGAYHHHDWRSCK